MSELRHDRVAAADGGLLLPLAGVAVALALWLGTESIVDSVRQLQQQLQSSAVRPSRDITAALEQAQADARRVRAGREAIEQGLQSTESPELLQTRFLYELRQRCAAAGVTSCLVKYASDASPAPAAAASAARRRLADRPAAEVGLDDLGLAKARAVVTGSFQAGELVDFVAALARDSHRAWRINGLVVRSNNFELDVEQIIRPPAGGRGAGNGS